MRINTVRDKSKIRIQMFFPSSVNPDRRGRAPDADQRQAQSAVLEIYLGQLHLCICSFTPFVTEELSRSVFICFSEVVYELK